MEQGSPQTTRIAILLPDLLGAGAQRVLFNLGCGLAERGYCVDFVLVRAEGPYLSQVPSNIAVVDLEASRAISSIGHLIGYLKEAQPIALLTGLHLNTLALWAKMLARVETRIVISEHTTISFASKSAANWRTRIRPTLARVFYNQADGIVAVSRGVADDLSMATGIDRDRITVIYNPVITADVIDKSKQPIDDPWLLSGEPPVILGVGRLAESKDFRNLINAFSIVRKERNARLLILGEGSYHADLQSQVADLGLEADVRLNGFTANPYPFMVHSSLFVLSSQWEGLPTVLIEALYCAPRVVSTDCPSGPREILDSGRFGELVPVKDSAALASAMIRALDKPPDEIPEQSWMPYELNVVVDQYLEVMQINKT